MTSKLNFFKKAVGPSALYPRALLFLIFLLALTSIIIWRFGSWMPDVFFGDDLSNLLHYKDGFFPRGLSEAVSVAFVEKYRPVFVWLMSTMFSAFDESISSYLAVNVLLHGLNATLVFAIAHRLSHGNWIVSLAVALTAATSRFAFYQVTQVTGFLEGIALTLFLLMTYCMVRASDESKEAAWRWSWLAVFTAFLVINTHERYIVVVAWLCLALIVIPSTRALPRGRLFTLLGACVAVGLSNALFKVVILKMPFFVGTGGTHMDLDIPRTLVFVMQAVLSIFGFNEGPEYLVGARAISLDWFPVWLLAAVISFAWLIAIVAGMRAALIEKVPTSAPWWQPFYWPLLLVTLGGLMLMPPALTIRMEQRWVLAPFIVTLLLFAWAAGVQRHRAIVPVWILAVAIGLGTVVSDTFIAAHFEQIFFVASGRFATVAKRDIVDKYPGQSTPVALIASGDHCFWTLIDGEFFRLYGGMRRTVSCFGSVAEVKSAALPENTRIYDVSYSPYSMTDVTSELQTLTPRSER